MFCNFRVTKIENLMDSLVEATDFLVEAQREARLQQSNGQKFFWRGMTLGL